MLTSAALSGLQSSSRHTNSAASGSRITLTAVWNNYHLSRPVIVRNRLGGSRKRRPGRLAAPFEAAAGRRLKAPYRRPHLPPPSLTGTGVGAGQARSPVPVHAHRGAVPAHPVPGGAAGAAPRAWRPLSGGIAPFVSQLRHDRAGRAGLADGAAPTAGAAPSAVPGPAWDGPSSARRRAVCSDTPCSRPAPVHRPTRHDTARSPDWPCLFSPLRRNSRHGQSPPVLRRLRLSHETWA